MRRDRERARGRICVRERGGGRDMHRRRVCERSESSASAYTKDLPAAMLQNGVFEADEVEFLTR